jgi:ribonuclease BN (tRNA processing enzyme)
MEITVLGGAAASPGPGQGCSSYLVESDGYRLVLDTGPNTLLELRRHSTFSDVDAVVISHLHSDHTRDIVPFRYGLRYGPETSGRMVELWMPPDGTEFLDRLAGVFAIGAESADTFFTEVFDVQQYDPDATLHLGPFELSFHPTRHYIPCWAMRITTEGKTLVYLADTGPFPPLVNFARDADLLICEATLPPGSSDQDEGAGHISPDHAGRLAAECGARRLLLTHMWSEFDAGAARRAAENAFGGPVTVAERGVQLEI